MTVRTPNNLVLQSKSEVGAVGRRKGDLVEPVAVKQALVGKQGQYTLRSWRDASGRPRQFPCTVLKFSAEFIKLAGPVTGSIGEWVIAYFENFGQFEGPVTETSERQFAMWIVANAEHRKKIENKIAWAKDKKSINKRRHERLAPRNPQSILRFSDGSSAPCQIIDYSLSGAAASAEISPKLGAIVKVGNIPGQVIRQSSEGFAVKFLLVQNRQTIEDLFKVIEP